MEFWDVLYTAAEKSGIPTTHIGEKLGLNRAYVAVGKNKGTDIGTSKAARLLGACGYVLAALPADDLPPGALVIDGADCDNQGDK